MLNTDTNMDRNWDLWTMRMKRTQIGLVPSVRLSPDFISRTAEKFMIKLRTDTLSLHYTPYTSLLISDTKVNVFEGV
jgi:hypothetical protein